MIPQRHPTSNPPQEKPIRFDAIPYELRALDQWVVWKLGKLRDNGKRAKMPINPRTGRAASHNDLSTCTSYDEAVEAFLSGNYKGIGFIFSADDPYTGVDLDDCVTDGQIDEDALAIVRSLDSYTEYSQSGTGVHVIVRADIPQAHRTKTIEIYNQDRYFVFTGRPVEGTPNSVEPRQTAVTALYERLFGTDTQDNGTPTGGGAPAADGDIVDIDDDALWERMFASKSGAKIKTLYDGDTISGDHSADVLAMLNHLAYWTAKDAGRMDRMFQQTGLYTGQWANGKWERLKDKDITKAIDGTTSVYTPDAYRRNGQRPNANTPPPVDVQTSDQADERSPFQTGEGIAEFLRANYEALGRQTTLNIAQPAIKKLDDSEWPVVEAALLDLIGDGDTVRAYLIACEPSPVESEVMADILRRRYRFRLCSLDDSVEVGDVDDPSGETVTMTDVKKSEIIVHMMDNGVKDAERKSKHMLNLLARENAYHPVYEYLQSLEWDGQNHIARFMSHFAGDGTTVTYANGSQQQFVHAIFYRWLLGCVSTTYEAVETPDNVFDYQNPMLVFIGKQGKGKSGVFKWLCKGIGERFMREESLDPKSKDHARGMCTRWIWEVAELGASLRRADRDSMKEFITKRNFTFRPVYKTYDVDKRRLCNLAGTLNDAKFLNDPTGHRRFLPVVLTDIDFSYKEHIDVNQLWAQIVHNYKQGESPQLLPEEKAVLEAAHEEHEIENPLTDYLQMYFYVDPSNGTMRTSTAEIIKVLTDNHISLPSNLRTAGREIGEALESLGLSSGRWTDGGRKVRGWIGIFPKFGA